MRDNQETLESRQDTVNAKAGGSRIFLHALHLRDGQVRGFYLNKEVNLR